MIQNYLFFLKFIFKNKDPEESIQFQKKENIWKSRTKETKIIEENVN